MSHQYSEVLQAAHENLYTTDDRWAVQLNTVRGRLWPSAAYHLPSVAVRGLSLTIRGRPWPITSVPLVVQLLACTLCISIFVFLLTIGEYSIQKPFIRDKRRSMSLHLSPVFYFHSL